MNAYRLLEICKWSFAKAVVLSIVFAFSGCGEGGAKNRINIYEIQSAGLLVDVKVLKDAIIKADKDREVNVVDFDEGPFNRAAVNIFLEKINTKAIDYAPENWVVVNPEQVEKPESYAKITKVLCKSRYCVDVMNAFKTQRNFAYEVVFIGFTSDISDSSVDLAAKDWDLFFHGAGKSPYKQTSKVLTVWRKNPHFPKLVVTCVNVGKSGKYPDCFHRHLVGDNSLENIRKNHPNIEIHTDFLPDDKVEHFQRTSGFVIAPSEVEGFGHYINESRGRGSIIITTDFPPMNEIIRPEYGILVKSNTVEHKGILNIPLQEISDAELENAVKKAISKTKNEKLSMAKKATSSFKDDKATFETNIRNLIEGVLPSNRN